MAMSTGDIKNNLKKLQQEIKLMKYGEPVNWKSIQEGDPKGLLPLYHFAFTTYSHAFAEKITQMDIEMFGKTDLRFMEAVYKVLRDYFNFKPPITKDQFFASGYAERKVIMCKEVLSLIREEDRKLGIFNPKPSSFKVTSNFNKRMSLPAGAKIGGSLECVRKETGEPGQDAAKSRKVAGSKFAVPHGRPPAATARRSMSSSAGNLTLPGAVGHQPAALNGTVPQHKASPPRVIREIVSPDSSQASGDSYSHLRPAPVAKLFGNDPGDQMGDSQLEVVDVVAATPNQSFSEQPADMSGLHSIGNQAMAIAKSIDQLLVRMEKVEETLAAVSGPARPQAPVPDNDLVNNLLQTINTLNARVLLLENRVVMLEDRAVMPENREPKERPRTNLLPTDEARRAFQPSSLAPRSDPSSNALRWEPPSCQSSSFPRDPYPAATSASPVLPPPSFDLNGSAVDSPRHGAFVSVESMVKGVHQMQELKRKKDLRKEAEAAPAAAAVPAMAEGQLSLLSGGDDTMVSIPDCGDPRRMSTPQRPGSDSSLDTHFMDASTQGRVKRITQMLEDTSTMVKGACQTQRQASVDSNSSASDL